MTESEKEIKEIEQIVVHFAEELHHKYGNQSNESDILIGLLFEFDDRFNFIYNFISSLHLAVKLKLALPELETVLNFRVACANLNCEYISLLADKLANFYIPASNDIDRDRILFFKKTIIAVNKLLEIFPPDILELILV